MTEEPIGGGHDRWFDAHLIKQLKMLQPKSIFDVGVGKGYNGKLIREALGNDIWLEGIEIFPDYITEETKEIYNNIVFGDVRTGGGDVWFDYQADVIIFGDVLEHMTHEEAMQVMYYIKGHFKWIIVNTPLGFLEHPEADGNEWEAHRCGLYPHDFDNFEVLDLNVRQKGIYAGLFNILLKGD